LRRAAQEGSTISSRCSPTAAPTPPLRRRSFIMPKPASARSNNICGSGVSRCACESRSHEGHEEDSPQRHGGTEKREQSCQCDSTVGLLCRPTQRGRFGSIHEQRITRSFANRPESERARRCATPSNRLCGSVSRWLFSS